MKAHSHIQLAETMDAAPVHEVGDQIARFTACVFDADDVVEVRRLPSGRSTWHRAGELSTCADTLVADNDDGQNIFVGINPRLNVGGRKAVDVATARCHFADFDGGVTPEQACQRCESVGLPTPTMVVASGHGCHLYWRLTEAVGLVSWTRSQKSLGGLLESDPSVHDPPRIMRLPGFVNHKAPAAECRLVEADPCKIHDVADLLSRFPVYDENAEKRKSNKVNPPEACGLGVVARAAAYLHATPGAVEGEGGDNHTFRVACVLVNDFGLTGDQAFPLMCEWNRKCVPPWPEPEIRQKLDHAAKYAKHPAGCKANTIPREAHPPAPPPTDSLPASPCPAWVMPREVMRRTEYSQGLRTVSTGLESLDRLMCGGFRCGSVTITAGRTGSAKSQLISNIARRAALSQTCTLFLTLEDSVTTAMWRIHAAASQVPIEILLDGLRGRGPAIDALRESFPLLADLPLRISDVRDLRHIRELVAKHVSSGGELVLLDQLSKVGTPQLAHHPSTYERVSLISEELRAAAMEHRIPIVVVCQVNREASKRSGDLELYDLRDSGMLEQDAAAVLLINKATVPPATIGQSRAFAKLLPVKLAKNRFGPAGETAELLWHPRIGRIDDLAMGDQR